VTGAATATVVVLVVVAVIVRPGGPGRNRPGRFLGEREQRFALGPATIPGAFPQEKHDKEKHEEETDRDGEMHDGHDNSVD